MRTIFLFILFGFSVPDSFTDRSNSCQLDFSLNFESIEIFTGRTIKGTKYLKLSENGLEMRRHKKGKKYINKHISKKSLDKEKLEKLNTFMSKNGNFEDLKSIYFREGNDLVIPKRFVITLKSLKQKNITDYNYFDLTSDSDERVLLYKLIEMMNDLIPEKDKRKFSLNSYYKKMTDG